MTITMKDEEGTSAIHDLRQSGELTSLDNKIDLAVKATLISS